MADGRTATLAGNSGTTGSLAPAPSSTTWRSVSQWTLSSLQATPAPLALLLAFLPRSRPDASQGTCIRSFDDDPCNFITHAGGISVRKWLISFGK